ncbi:MAG: formylglycine-generating enzyme family protein [Planctomycetes bacterium]|nr:formylglycine-generating enzyme family protein [Planctomycetota bacterium]
MLTEHRIEGVQSASGGSACQERRRTNPPQADRTPALAVCALLLTLSSCGREPSNEVGKAAARSDSPAAEPARSPQPPKVMKTESGVEMVLIPGGSFMMGDAQGADDVKPVRKVSVSSFWMDKHEVTQASYEDLIGNNPAKHEGDKNPIEQVRWTQAARYCNARSLKEGLKPCYDEQTWKCDFEANGYRLPTEAEWEYACRAGASKLYSFGDDAQGLRTHAWFKENSGKKPHSVGEKPANAWGLHDMHGNVSEWCNDWHAADYYKSSPEKDPRGPETGQKRVLRGGSFNSPPAKCAASFRYCDAPALPDVCLGYDEYGFRCVRKAAEGP